jgi:CubicO group peptidase (beta-lactamase class C family)
LIEAVDEKLQAAVDRTFAVDNPPLRRTTAVVVVHDGRIVAERYALGYSITTRLIGYSLSKSIINALLGILVREHRLSVDGPAPVRAWRGGRSIRATRSASTSWNA